MSILCLKSCDSVCWDGRRRQIVDSSGKDFEIEQSDPGLSGLPKVRVLHTAVFSGFHVKKT